MKLDESITFVLVPFIFELIVSGGLGNGELPSIGATSFSAQEFSQCNRIESIVDSVAYLQALDTHFLVLQIPASKAKERREERLPPSES